MNFFLRRQRPAEQQFQTLLNAFMSRNKNNRFENEKIEIIKCLDDNTATTAFDAHYIYHPAWAARVIRSTGVKKHVDISSTLHFCTLLSAFVETEFYDYRPALLNLDNLQSKHADLTNLPFPANSIQSLSCMHTIEHIGLGRYGDPIDPDGDLKAIEELKKVCAIGGSLLIVVPVGIRKLVYNAHRIYDPQDMIKLMDNFQLHDFSLIDDTGQFTPHTAPENASQLRYGCGCYWFIKINDHY